MYMHVTCQSVMWLRMVFTGSCDVNVHVQKCIYMYKNVYTKCTCIKVYVVMATVLSVSSEMFTPVHRCYVLCMSTCVRCVLNEAI